MLPKFYLSDMRKNLLLLFFAYLLLPFSCDRNESTILELDRNELTLEVGEKETIKVIKAPDTGETIVWSSDNEKTVSVFFGTLTALATGTATITATLGELSAQCVVTVPEREYELVWSDEFDGTSLNLDNWTYETGTGTWGWGNNEEEYYTSRKENIRIENGFLVIEARKEAYNGSSYTSARIKSLNKQEFAYGKIEARLKVPAGAGTWPAFWMLGKIGSWPGCGEIDIMEHVGIEPKNLHCALHTLNKNGMNGQNFSATQTLQNNVADDFHILTLEWVENEFLGYDRMHFYVDGVKTATFGETSQLQETNDWPFTSPFYFIINLALGGNWGGDIDDAIFENPVLYQLDYVRVYQYK